MTQKIAHITLLVNDYDEAIDFYTKKLKFNLIEDTNLSDTKRWVIVAPAAKNSSGLLLAKAETEEQKRSVGNQSGGRVFMFLYTNNFDADLLNLKANNIKIIREAKTEPYGKVLVFSDLYGNMWDLIEPTNINE